MFVSSGNGFVSNLFPCSSQRALLGVGSMLSGLTQPASVSEHGWGHGPECLLMPYVPGGFYILPESSLKIQEIIT